MYNLLLQFETLKFINIKTGPTVREHYAVFAIVKNQIT